MAGGWRLFPSAEGCRVEVWWRVKTARPWFAPLLLPVMAHAVARDFPPVIASMVACAEGGPAPARMPLRLRAAFLKPTGRRFRRRWHAFLRALAGQLGRTPQEPSTRRTPGADERASDSE